MQLLLKKYSNRIKIKSVDKKYLLGSMPNSVVQVQVRMKANATVGHVSKEKLPESGAHFKSEDIGIHCEKENLLLLLLLSSTGSCDKNLTHQILLDHTVWIWKWEQVVFHKRSAFLNLRSRQWLQEEITLKFILKLKWRPRLVSSDIKIDHGNVRPPG